MGQPVIPSFLVVHPTGNTYVRNDLQALYEAGCLREYFTGFGFSRESILAQFPGPASLRLELERRAYDLPSQLIHTRHVLASNRLLAMKPVGPVSMPCFRTWIAPVHGKLNA